MADIEAPIKSLLRTKLEKDFFIFDSLEGRHKHTGELVKYDLVLKPRQKLIENGFDDGYVVVVTKLFNLEESKKHDTKAKDMLWQCVAYSFSEIKLSDESLEKPLFVLYYMSGSFDSKYAERLRLLHHFVQRGGVGRLDFNKNDGWEMVFGGSFYFRQKFGKGPHHVGTKRQTGSSRWLFFV